MRSAEEHSALTAHKGSLCSVAVEPVGIPTVGLPFR